MVWQASFVVSAVFNQSNSERIHFLKERLCWMHSERNNGKHRSLSSLQYSALTLLRVSKILRNSCNTRAPAHHNSGARPEDVYICTFLSYFLWSVKKKVNDPLAMTSVLGFLMFHYDSGCLFLQVLWECETDLRLYSCQYLKFCAFKWEMTSISKVEHLH